MRFEKSIKFLASVFALLALSSCKITTPPVTLTVSPGPVTTVNSGTLTCAASTSLASVISGQSFPVTIQVSGGAGPYSLSGLNGTFLTTYTLPQVLTTSASGTQVISSNFTVTDSTGASTTCSLAVTVAPVTSTNPLSCTVAASNENPTIDQNVTYTATVGGGSSSAAYYFTAFIPGGNGVTTSSLNQITATQATASARYPSAGLNTAVFYVSDSNANSATCAKTVNVQSGPSVTLTATPSATVPATSAITVTATPTNFSATPTYTFSVSGSGINLSASGAVATVTAVDATTTRTGTVTVTAVNGSQSATNSIPVTFTASSSTLNCSLSYANSVVPYKVGDNVPYSITASTGEALTVTELNIMDGYLVGGTLSQYPYISFYLSGYKTVTAKARSASTGTLCNGGALLNSTIYISPGTSDFNCTLSMNPNPTYTYRWIQATVTPSGAQGAYWLESLTAESAQLYTYDDGASSLQSSSASTPIVRWVYFTYPGNFQVTARLRDSAGRTATCSTYEVIY